MCTAQKSGQSRDSIAVPRASSHWARFSCPCGVGRGGGRWPAAARKRSSARPWKVSSWTQQARNAATSGSLIARVARSDRRYTIVWLSMSCMYRSVRMASGDSGCFGTSSQSTAHRSTAPERARYVSMSKVAIPRAKGIVLRPFNATKEWWSIARVPSPITTSGHGRPDRRARSAGLVELLVQTLHLLVKGLAAAVGHRRLVREPGMELDEQRPLVAEHRRQAPLEVIEIGDGVRLPVAGALGHLHEIDGEPAGNLLGPGSVIDAVLENEMREVAG